ncbi:TonB-dependent receptor [bacterium]|nr:TonB-dependent receptor [bacterium]
MKQLIVLLLLLGFNIESQAVDFTGWVMDEATEQPLSNCHVWLQDSQTGTVTNQEGAFRLAGLTAGRYQVSISHLGYQLQLAEVLIPETNGRTWRLQPRILPNEEVVITTNRIRLGASPAAFTNIPHQQLQEENFAQDLTDLLDGTPSLTVLSYSGGDFGYRSIKLRGFDQRRIGVMINGIPLNDPEDHQVYWVDMPDLGSSLDDVQIVRGVGSSFMGSNEFGGTINMRTATGEESEGGWIRGGGGSYSTRQLAWGYSSGLLANRSFSVRFSTLSSEEFRRRAGVEMWSYYLSTTRYLTRGRITLNAYGGQEKCGQAFDAIPASIYARDRRYNNYAAYPNSIDHFSQPHFELILLRKLTSSVTLDSRLYYIRGNGYYENLKTGQELSDFGFTPYTDTEGNLVEEADFIRRKVVDKEQLGLVSQIIVGTQWGRLICGLDSYGFRSRHHGRVLWASEVAPGESMIRDYYRYNGEKLNTRLFLTDEFQAGEQLRLTGHLQLVYKRYRFDQLAVANFTGDLLNDFTDRHFFLQPKFGALWSFNERCSLWAGAGKSFREPSDSDYWDSWQGPDDLGRRPLFGSYTTASDGGREWSESNLQPEEIWNYELGLHYRSPRWLLLVNGYYTSYFNEIVTAGDLDDEGSAPLKGNVAESLHKGIELEAGFRFNDALALRGNYSWSVNEAINFTTWEYDWDTGESNELDLSGRILPLFPDLTANLRVNLEPMPGLILIPTWQYVGRQYLDFTEQESRSIDPHALLNLTVRYQLPQRLLHQVEFSLHLKNLLNREYETGGYYDAWLGENSYYPGAPRRGYLTLQVRF